MPFAFEKKLAPMSPAHSVFFFFFHFKQKIHVQVIRKFSFKFHLNVNFHFVQKIPVQVIRQKTGFSQMRQRWWSLNLYRLCLMLTDYCLAATSLKELS